MDNKFLNRLSTFLLYISILIFIIAFNFAHNPPSGWYQQFMPNLGGRSISEIFFLDSLTGWAVTPYIDLDDTAYVLKTTNGGDNWEIIYTRAGAVGFARIFFLDSETGFACGTNDVFGYKGLSKSTDGGMSWIQLNVPDPFVQFEDMNILNEDTIWLAAGSSTGGGLFRTTNGGQSWIRQFGGSSNNPDREIIRLVNDEFKTAGKYTVEFDGTNLSSGVYFYRLEVSLSNPLQEGEFMNTKRMVLIK